jgi:hypothetical protein
MPSLSSERSLDRGPIALFRGWRHGRRDNEPVAPSAPVIESAPAAETPPHVETDLEKTATHMKSRVKSTIEHLSRFPSGTNFENLIYLETNE